MVQQPVVVLPQGTARAVVPVDQRTPVAGGGPVVEVPIPRGLPVVVLHRLRADPSSGRVRDDPVGSGPRLGSALVVPRLDLAVPTPDWVHPFPSRLHQWPVVSDVWGRRSARGVVEQVLVEPGVAVARRELAVELPVTRQAVVVRVVGAVPAELVGMVAAEQVVAAVVLAAPAQAAAVPVVPPVAVAVQPVSVSVGQAWVETAVAVSDG